MSLYKQNVRVSDMFTASKVINSVVPRYWHSIPRLSLCVCVFAVFEYLASPRRLVGCEHF